MLNVLFQIIEAGALHFCTLLYNEVGVGLYKQEHRLDTEMHSDEKILMCGNSLNERNYASL